MRHKPRTLNPASGGPDARVHAGIAVMRQGDPGAAVEIFQSVLKSAPTHLGAQVSLGSAFLALGRPEAAEACYRQALDAHPRNPLVLRNLGVLIDANGRHEDGLALAEAALAEAPDLSEALVIQGNAFMGLGRFEDAATSYRRAADPPANAYEALTKVGLALAALGQYDGALMALDRAVALQPDAPVALFRRAIVRLQLRDFAGGWPGYEARWGMENHIAQSAGVIPRALVPRLETAAAPKDLIGQRILLLGEQGIGDQVMFASLLPDLLAAAARVVCVCDPRLARLFSASFPSVTFSGPNDAAIDPDTIDKILAMGSLGRLYRTSVQAFPGQPYLRPGPDAAKRWAERLGDRQARLRIGLSWRGGTSATRRDSRSLALEQLAPILDLPGCEFVSLQYGDPRPELAAFNAGRDPPIRVFDPEEISDFEELAALTANLDLVVSVQTAVVHLAGALGVPCLTMVPHNAEWRYAAQGEDMAWYRSVRLFRQSEPDAWVPVIQKVADHIRATGD